MPRFIGFYNWDNEDDQPVEDQNSGIVGDTMADLQVGVGQLKQATYALGDLAARPFRSADDETFSERLAKSDADEIGSDAWMARKQAAYSQDRQESERSYQEAVDSHSGEWGKLGGTMYGLITNPRAAFGRVVQSAPAMVAGGGVGGAAVKGGAAVGMLARGSALAARTARVGAAAAEGIQSGANNAYDAINYNVNNGRGRYEGVGASQALTAIGVGATSLLAGKVGGGIEASIFNKEARAGLATGWRGTGRAVAGEGGEEGVQSLWETIPQNISLDKPWNQDLGQNIGEGVVAGGGMGGGVHLTHRALGTIGQQSMLETANRAPEPQPAQAEQPAQPQAPAEPPVQPQAPVEPQGSALPPNVGAPQPQQPDIVGEAVDKTPMAGAQPQPPVQPQPPQPTKEEIKAQQEQAKAEKKVQQEQAKAEKKAQDEAIKQYKKNYGVKEVEPQVALEDARQRQENPEWARRMDLLGKVDAALGHPVNIKRNKATADSFNGKSDEELADMADQFAAMPIQKPEMADELAATALALRNPEADLRSFIAERQAGRAQEAYRQSYGDEPSRTKSIPPSEIKADKTWRAANPQDVPRLDKLVQANVASGAHKTPKALRELAYNHHNFKDEEFAKKCLTESEKAKDAVEADFYAAVAEVMTNPKADLSQLIQKRNEANLKAVAAKEQAHEAEVEAKEAAKAEKKAKKAEKPKEAPKVLRVPTPDEWEKMTDYQRKLALDEAEKSGDTHFHLEMVALDKRFKEHQAKEAKKAEEPKKEEAPKAEEKPVEAPKAEEPPKKTPKKEAAPKAEEKPAEAQKAEEKPKAKKATKKVVKPEKDTIAQKAETPALAYLAAARNLAPALKEAGLQKKSQKGGIPFNTVASPEFQKKVLDLYEPAHLFAAQELAKAAKAYHPEFDLELPSSERIAENKNRALVKEDEEAVRATKKAVVAAKKTKKTTEPDAEKPTTKQERDALALHEYFKDHLQSAFKEAKEVGSTEGLSDEEVVAMAVRSVSRPFKDSERRAILRSVKTGDAVEVADDATEAEAHVSEEAEEDQAPATVAEKGGSLSDESALDIENSDLGDKQVSGDTEYTQGAGRVSKGRGEMSLEDIPGTKIVAQVKKAYKDAKLPDLNSQPVERLIPQLEAVENAIVEKLPEVMYYYDRDRYGKPTGGKHINIDGIQEAFAGYMEFAEDFFKDAPEELRAWAGNSPVVSWILKQVSTYAPKANAYTRPADPEADDAIAKGGLAITALLKKRNGDGGWFKHETEDQIRKDLQGRTRSPEAQKIFGKSTYWISQYAQGVAVPLQFAVSVSKNLEADLATIVDPRVAKTTAYAVKCFQDVGKPIPNVYVMDLSRQVTPSRGGIDVSGLSRGSVAFQVSGFGYGSLLESGKPELLADRNLVCFSVNSTPDAGADPTLINYWKNTGVHEFLHAEDEESHIKTGALISPAFTAEIAKTEDAIVLKGLSGAIAVENTGGNVDEWLRDNPVYDKPKVRDLLVKLTPDERARIEVNFFYPTDKATRMWDNGMSAVACDDTYQRETYAVFASAMFDGTLSKAFIEANFPDLAKLITPYVTGKGSSGSNANNTSSVRGPHPQRPVFNEARFLWLRDRVSGTQGEGGRGEEARSAEDLRREKVQARVEGLKSGEVAAKLRGLDTKLYESKEWQDLAKAVAEAELDHEKALGAVNGLKGAIARALKAGKDVDELHDKAAYARKAEEAAALKAVQARQALNDFEDSHRQKVEPPKGEVVRQAGVQFGYNKLADALGRRFNSPTLRKTVNEAGAWAYRHGLGMMFTRDLVDTVKDKLHSVTRWAQVNNKIDQLSREHQDKAVKIGQEFRNLSQKEQDAVNQCLMDSVMDGKWYDIPLDNKGVEIVKAEVEPNAAYEQLSEDAKQVYRDVLRMGHDTRATIMQFTKEEIERRYANRIEATDDEGKKEDLRKQMKRDTDLVEARFGSPKSPYVPLRRFGNYVVVLKSQEYADAVANYLALRDAANDKGATTRDKREAEEARRTVLTLQSNGKDYIVEYADTADDAMLRAKELEKDSTGAASYFERNVFMKSEQLNIHQLIHAVDKTERMAAGMDDDFSKQSQAVKEKLAELATTMYIQSLSDNSALKSRLHRRKVSGASHDMMRAFMSTASSESRYLGYLKFGGELREALSAMEDEVRTSNQRAAAQAVFNEVRQRIELGMTPQSQAASGILRTTSMMMLLTNPAFFLQNLSQPLLYSASYMAGRFGMYRPLKQTASQMMEVAKWLKADGTLSDLDKLVESKAISGYERDMLVQMRENGLLDIGLSQEFGEFNRAAMSPAMSKVVGVTDMLAGAARKVEVINRVSSALVAFRLEKARLMGKGVSEVDANAQATTFADHVLYETHGDYSSRNAPRYFKMNDFARVVTQFRKFQLIQLGLFTRMVKQALDSSNPEMQKFARRGLAYTMASFLAVTGVKGLPLYGVIALALGLAGGPGDDDEDVFRKTLADAGVEKPVIDLIVRGLPAMLGVDLSDKLGAGNILSPFPYLEGNKALMKNGPDDALEVLAQVLGPAASLLVRGSRGASYGWQGDYTKAAENLLPSGFANLIKAVRFGTEGITTKAGDVVVPGEKFTFGDIISQAIGLPSTKVTSRNQLVSSLYRHEEAYNQWAKQIRYSFTQAVKDKNAGARMKAIREWAEMNQARKKAGFAPRPLKLLTSSATQQAKRERTAVGGVETNKSNRGFMQKQTALYQ